MDDQQDKEGRKEHENSSPWWSTACSTASDAQHFLRSLGYNISKRSVRRLLQKLGFKSGIKKHKPFISYTNQKKRIKWCRDKASWTVEDWKSVVFSNETNINVWGADGIRCYGKQVEQSWRSFHADQTMKHGGGSIMLSGCITSRGPGYARRVYDDAMDSQVYTHILSITYRESLAYYGLKHLTSTPKRVRSYTSPARLHSPLRTATPPVSLDWTEIIQQLRTFKNQLISRRSSFSSGSSTQQTFYSAPNQLFTDIMTTDSSTEFSQYLIHEKAKSVPANNYQLDHSLRVWFIEFEQQAAAHGISNLNSCAVHLSKYMPLLIQRWIPTLPPTVRSDYELLKESLLARFAMDIEEENRLLLKQLRSYQRDTRLTLTSLVTALNINRLSEVIRQAIDLEVRAKLLDAPELADDNNVATPMEIDYVGKYHGKRHNNKFNKQRGQTQQPHYNNNYHPQRNNQHHKFNGNTNNPKQQGTQVPRLYNKQGDPVCGYCFKLHRTIDCNQYQKGRKNHSSERHSIHTTEAINVEQHQVDLEEPIKVVQTNTIVAQSINYVNFQHTNTPLSFIQIDNAKITALWDTGSTITCVSSEVAHLLKLKIDTTKSILYTDVNKNVNRSHGQVKLNMFNTTITLQVIDNMARDVIIGFDTMIKWKAIINVDEQIVAIKANNQTHRIEFTNNSQPNSSAGPPHSINFTSVIQPQIDDLLTKYNSIIPKDNDKPSTTAIVEFNIDTGDAPPVYSAPRIYHPEIQKKIDDKMEKLVDLGIVNKVLFSEWGSNITAVPKPNGDIRPCGNYVKLNAITKTIKYPFIHLHHALQSLGTSTIFSKIDLASGYYAIKIKAEDREKTALVTPNGTYVFNYMPFGLKNAPAVFQSMMDRVLGPLKNVTAIAYLDDIIIHSKSPSKHILDVEQVLSRLKAANLSINKEKCAFGLKSVEFLGFIVSDKGISANPEKIAPILALSAPTILKEVERFLGVCGVYQKFISNFQVVAEPLRRLKKKDTPFVWTEEQQNSFETLKKKLAELPTLPHPRELV
ncbi:hypothetical protein G6F23_008820 [Rhizopus arrhizus]|nr:hypothetical protein G6F23_008820 [Rhizopus arrhizus]